MHKERTNIDIRHLNQIRNFIKIPPTVFMPIANGIFIFNPPPSHFGWLVFAFIALYRPPDYVYKIWFSLVQGQEFSFFDPPPRFWVFSFCISSSLWAPRLSIQNLVEFAPRARIYIFFTRPPLWVVFEGNFSNKSCQKLHPLQLCS